jgi:spermidine synthase
MGTEQSAGGGARTNVLTCLALLSGSCGLAYEVLYVRALTSVLGDMFYVHAALLSTFLIGVGLGAKAASRCRRWLWAFEILTGLYALVLPIAAGWFSDQIASSIVTASPTLTILVTIGFVTIPSVLIGFSIPLFSAYIKADLQGRPAFQGIYKAYNLGALLSVLGVELLLVRAVGVRLSLATVGAVNLINGVVLLLMKAAPASPPTETPRRFPRRTMVALALASFCSAAFQMFFLKLCYLVFAPHRENFAIGLAVAMLGIFLGAWFGSKVRIRFETLLLLIAAVLGLNYVAYLPILELWEATSSWSRGSELLVLVHKFGFGCLFALGPMLLFGATIPVLMRTEGEVAAESGHLLWISSLAMAAGYLAYVLLGHPLVATDVLLTVVGGITIAGALVATGSRWSKAQTGLAIAAVALFALLLATWQEQNFHLAQHRDRLEPGDEVTIFKSGAESATLVRGKRNDWISYNGHPSIGVEIGGVVNTAELICGIIPALSAPRLDRALVIGLGSGITAGAASRVFTATDVVEINDAFYAMMPELSRANLEIAENPTASLHLSDGRAFLIGKQGVYDAIINSVSAPTYFSASKIYTLEFYERVVQALRPDGVFSTWLAAPDMSEMGIETMLSALRHSFRYCDLRLMRGSYYMTTCSNQPIRVRQFGELPVQQNLLEELQRGFRSLDADELFEDTRVSANLFEHHTPMVAKENTDDHPVLEFMVVRSYQLGEMGTDPFVKQQHLWNIDPVRSDEVNDPARMARRAGLFYVLRSGFFRRNFEDFLKETPDVEVPFLVWKAEGLATEGGSEEAIRSLKEALRIEPDFAPAHAVWGAVLASRGDRDQAIDHYRQALEIDPDLADARDALRRLLEEPQPN